MKKIGWIIGVIILLAIGVVTYKLVTDKEEPSTSDEYKKPEVIEIDEKNFDVIVIGTEPEGVAAAVSAARNGAKTLLVDPREELGGLFTYGMLNFLDIPQGHTGESVSKGIYQEWHNLVGNQSAFGIEEAKAAFLKLVNDEENITLAVSTKVTDVKVENKTIKSVTLQNNEGTYNVSAPSFIDATQDGDFAVLAGAPYFVGGEDLFIDKKMAVTLMIHLRGVDWNKLVEFGKDNPYGTADFNATAGWGFGKLHTQYQAITENTRLRGLNIAKVNDDIYINALQIFGIDGLSSESKAKAIEMGKKEIDHIVEFFNENFEGMENAYVASYPEELYVRETRHIVAEYQLPMSDVWTNADHEDRIGYGAYPVDVQAQTPQDYGYVLSDPIQYAIPFRTLVPQEIDGLLIASRSAGYSSLAAGSARVVPTGMVLGEAAGVAAILAQKYDKSFREISKDMDIVKEMQAMLNDQGQYVDAYKSTYPYQGEWFDTAIQTVSNYGALSGGYNNDLQVDNELTNKKMMDLLYRTIPRMAETQDKQLKEQFNQVYTMEMQKEGYSLTKDAASQIIVQMLFNEVNTNAWDKLVSEGIISETTKTNITSQGNLKVKDGIALVSDIVNHYSK